MPITDYLSPLTQASAGMPSPLQSFAQGQQVGGALQQASRDTTVFNQQQADRQKAIEAATQKAIADAKAAAEIQADLDAAAEAGSTEAIEALMVKRPQLAENLKKAHAAKSETQKAETNRIYGSALAATQNGEPLVAVDFLNRSAAALKEKNPQEAQALERLAGMVDANPTKGAFILETYLTVNGGKELIEGIQTNKQGAAALQAKQAEADEATAKADSAAQEAALKTREVLSGIGKDEGQIKRWEAESANEAGRLKLDRDKFNAEKAAAEKAAVEGVIEIPKDVREAIEADASSASSSAGIARKGLALADKFKKDGPIGGLVGGTRDAVAGVVGVDTKAADYNEQYIDIRNQLMRARRKPGEGVYTDADAERDQKAFAGEGASSKAKERTLRLLASEADLAAKLHRAAGRFRALTGGPGKSRIPVVIDGATIPAGTSLGDLNAIMEDHYLAPPTTPTKQAPIPGAKVDPEVFNLFHGAK